MLHSSSKLHQNPQKLTILTGAWSGLSWGAPTGLAGWWSGYGVCNRFEGE